VSITGLNPKYCLNAGNATLSGSPAGGTFSGPGVAGNVFQPSQIGVGNWCITYTYVDPLSGCSSDTTTCIVVDTVPALLVSGYNNSYCHMDSPVTLKATPQGGTYSGPGIVGNIFYPANANTGNNIISYTYTDTVFGCSNTTQFSININAVPSLTIAASDSMVCPGTNVSLSAQYSTDVFNIAWSNISGGTIFSGLNGFTVNPTGADHCYVATAVNTPGCVTRDTICIQILDCYIHAVDIACDADSMYINDTITVRVLANDTLPSLGNDTIVTIKTPPSNGSAVVNKDHTITYIPGHDFSGNTEFSYQVCIEVRGLAVCDTADVCITVVDTTIHCHFPNTITPNNDGVNDEFIISCNDEYPTAEIRIYDRWGAEVYRSMGHYNNDWKGYNQQGILVPDGTYFYMYYFNNGSNRMKKGFVDVYR
jgi:gliding motility-associated-like protein